VALAFLPSLLRIPTQQHDGVLAVWSDDIQLPGQVRPEPGIQPATQTLEHYGEIAKAEVNAPNQVKVELRAYTPICCFHPFAATLSADGKSMTGNWLAGAPIRRQRQLSGIR
jgi:hypothetical protein